MRHLSIVLLFLAALARQARAASPEVGFDQRIGQTLPMGAIFTAGDGLPRPLRSYFGGKPGVLIFDYFHCPEMCSLVASGATDALRQLEATVGKQYVVVTVSIDPTDTPAMADSRQRGEVLRYGRTGASAGWHVLVGKAEEIQALTEAAGFHYRFDPRSGQYAHPSGFVIVTPSGTVSSYFLGIDYAAGDMAAAIRRAGENKTGKSVFSLLFVCFQGGSQQGRYDRTIWVILWASVAATVAAVFGGIAVMLRHERRARTASMEVP